MGCRYDQQALDEARNEKSILEAPVLNHAGKKRREKRRAGSEACGDNTRSEAPAVREPLESNADRTAVHNRSAKAGERVKSVELPRGGRETHAAPTRGAEDPGQSH